MNAVSGQQGLTFLPSLKKGDPFSLFKHFLDHDSSREARELLSSLSPALRHYSQDVKPEMVLLPGSFLPKDKPRTSVVRSFAGNLECDRPHFFDALFLCKVLTPVFFAENINWVIVMHQPIKEQVLGIACENGKVILTANEADPRKGWYARRRGFVFRAR